MVPQIRSEVWRLLSDYIPIDQELREETLARKREEYEDLVCHYFGEYSPKDTIEILSKKVEEMSSYEITNFRQIKIDVIRTQPEVVLFSQQPLQSMLIRILFIWSMRHPASAYVQGINDLAAPLILVFLGALVAQYRQNQEMVQAIPSKREKGNEDSFVESKQTITTAQINAKTSIYHEITASDLLDLDAKSILSAEADVFWCLSKLIDEIQDNFTDMQPGVHKMLNKMKAVVNQVDP